MKYNSPSTTDIQSSTTKFFIGKTPSQNKFVRMSDYQPIISPIITTCRSGVNI